MLTNIDEKLTDLSKQAKPYVFYEKVTFQSNDYLKTISKSIDYGYNFLLRKIIIRYPEKYQDASKDGTGITLIGSNQLLWCKPTMTLNKVSDNRTFQDTEFSPVLIGSYRSCAIFQKLCGFISSSACNGIVLNQPFVFNDTLQIELKINPQNKDFYIDVVCSGVMTPEKTIPDWGNQ